MKLGSTLSSLFILLRNVYNGYYLFFRFLVVSSREATWPGGFRLELFWRLRFLSPSQSHWWEVDQLYWSSKNQVWGFLIFLIAFLFLATPHPQLPLPCRIISLLQLPLAWLFFFFCILRCESWDPRVKPFLSFPHRPSATSVSPECLLSGIS